MTGDRLPMEICSALGAGRGSVSVEVAADTRVGAEADNMQHIAGYFAVTAWIYYYLSKLKVEIIAIYHIPRDCKGIS